MFVERRIRVMTLATSLEYDLRAIGRPLVWKCRVGAWRIYAVLWRQGTISKEQRVGRQPPCYGDGSAGHSSV